MFQKKKKQHCCQNLKIQSTNCRKGTNERMEKALLKAHKRIDQLNRFIKNKMNVCLGMQFERRIEKRINMTNKS